MSRSIAAALGTCPDGQYVTAPLNPPGRGEAEQCAGPKAKLLKCKKDIILATMNTRTIMESKRQLELARNIKVQNILVMGIQEHRIIHKDPTQKIIHHKIGDQYLVTSTAWRTRAQSACGGVGIAMSPTAKKALRGVKSISERVLMASFQSNPTTTIISAYSPTSDATEEVMKNFYESLSDAIQSVPAHNFLAVLGFSTEDLGQTTYLTHITRRQTLMDSASHLF